MMHVSLLCYFCNYPLRGLRRGEFGKKVNAANTFLHCWNCQGLFKIYSPEKGNKQNRANLERLCLKSIARNAEYKFNRLEPLLLYEVPSE